VREKGGLAYGVKSHVDAGSTYGYLLIWAGIDPANEAEVQRIIEEEYAKMKELTAEEVQIAKERLIGLRSIEAETTHDTAMHLVFEELWGNAENYYGYGANIEHVTLEDVRNLAENVSFSKFIVRPKTS